MTVEGRGGEKGGRRRSSGCDLLRALPLDVMNGYMWGKLGENRRNIEVGLKFVHIECNISFYLAITQYNFGHCGNRDMF